MKTHLFLAMCCLGTLVIAQAETPKPAPTQGILATRDMNGNVKMPDGLAVIKGALMYIKGGKLTRVNNELKLSEGITARPNRQVTLANGKTLDLQEGQMVTLDGKLTTAPVGLGSTAPGSASFPPAIPQSQNPASNGTSVK
jgi:hypothetical protein